jgi:hypothetical protein
VESTNWQWLTVLMTILKYMKIYINKMKKQKNKNTSQAKRFQNPLPAGSG